MVGCSTSRTPTLASRAPPGLLLTPVCVAMCVAVCVAVCGAPSLPSISCCCAMRSVTFCFAHVLVCAGPVFVCLTPFLVNFPTDVTGGVSCSRAVSWAGQRPGTHSQASGCDTLQHTATDCNALQHTATQ